MKKLMILGAGIYQVPLIKKAHEMGLYTIVISIPGDYPGFEFADKIYYENTTNAEAVLKIAKHESIDGIITTGTDVALSTLGLVCDTLNLSGVSHRVSVKSCNKILMKKELERGNVNIAKYYVGNFSDALSDTIQKCSNIGYPVVIKAVDSSGSRGITVVNDESMIKNAVESAKSVSRENLFLIEEFLDGTEYGADAFIINGEIQFIIPHGKYVYYANTGVPVGHYAPYEDDDVIKETALEATKAIKAMGFNNCCINFDLMLVDGVPYVIEVGARAGATCIPEIISLYNGFDYYEEMIKSCLSKNNNSHEIVFQTRNSAKYVKASSARLLFSKKSGVLKEIKGLDFSKSNKSINDEGIYEIVIDKSPGDQINAFSIGPDRIGHIIAYANTVKRAEAIIDDILKDFEIVLE